MTIYCIDIVATTQTHQYQADQVDVWASTTTLLCSIFLPVLVKAIPCIGKDLGMSTISYASRKVQLHKDSYTSKTNESHIL